VIFQGTKCDLITGEERRYADPEGKPANHVACTVEMTNLTTVCKENFQISSF